MAGTMMRRLCSVGIVVRIGIYSLGAIWLGIDLKLAGALTADRQDLQPLQNRIEIAMMMTNNKTSKQDLTRPNPVFYAVCASTSTALVLALDMPLVFCRGAYFLLLASLSSHVSHLSALGDSPAVPIAPNFELLNYGAKN